MRNMSVRNRHIAQAVAVVILLAAALLVPRSARATTGADAEWGTTTGGVRLLGGTIRQDTPGSGWYLISGGHTAHNLSMSPTGTPGAVVLDFPVTAHIVSVLCGPDETYAQLGYTCGVSAGYSTLTVKIGQNGVPVDPATLSGGPYANFWILGFVEA